MTEEVFEIQRYSVGHRIDKQLLVSLEDIFRQYTSDVYIKYSVECNNNTVYKFDSMDECFEYFSRVPYRIVYMEIDALFGDINNRREITLTFSNKSYAFTEVKFRFNNTDDYLILKNKIELCLKNFRLNYRFFSVIPILPVLLTVVFVLICVYTNMHNIIFPRYLQVTITWGWIMGSLLCLFLPFIVSIKRNLFPCTEFRIGQNELVENKNFARRSFIIGTIVCGIILGILVNCISNFLFQS